MYLIVCIVFRPLAGWDTDYHRASAIKIKSQIHRGSRMMVPLMGRSNMQNIKQESLMWNLTVAILDEVSLFFC